MTGSDGMVHLEYDLVLTNVFTAPVTITAIDVLTPDGQSLLRLEGDALEAMTQPLFGRTPTDVVPQSGALAAMLDVVVPPDQVPERLTHRITYELAPDAPLATIIGSREIVGPELAVDPFAPVVIAPPLRGAGWVNANGCCDASAHRSARLAVDGAHLVKFETFAIDWIRLEGTRLFAGDGTRNEDYFAFGAEVLAVADGTVVFVRDGIPEETPNEPPTTVHQPLDYGGNEVVLELAPGVYAFYAHLQPGSIRVQIGETVTSRPGAGVAGQHRQLDRPPPALPARRRARRLDGHQPALRHRQMDVGRHGRARRARPPTSSSWGLPSPKRRHVAPRVDRRRLPLSRAVSSDCPVGAAATPAP